MGSSLWAPRHALPVAVELHGPAGERRIHRPALDHAHERRRVRRRPHFAAGRRALVHVRHDHRRRPHELVGGIRPGLRLVCQQPGGSATASGPRTAASSPPSSRPTCQGTTPRRRATSVRASASTRSTSSSRWASASRPSPTWTHQTIVPAALAAKSSAETPKKACWERSLGSHASVDGAYRRVVSDT
jgi:hypothetical protein